MTRPWLVAALLLPLATNAGLPLHAQSTALNDGVELIRKGQFNDALVKLEEAQKAAPGNATIENLLGIVETQLGHIDEACGHYRNSIRLDPSQAAPHRNLGYDLLNQKDFAHAEPELREASHLDPKDAFAHFYLTLLALETSHDAEAVAQASLAGKLVDNDPQAATGLIAAEVRLGDINEATAKIEALEASGQLSTVAEYPIAVALARRQSYGEAVHCFRRIAATDPSWENRYNLALGLLYDGQPEEASTLLSGLHVERPSHADTLMFLGSAFEQQQKMPQALDAYRSALAEDPANPDRALDYTRLLMDLDRFDEAVQVIQSGLKETSSPAALELRLGAVEMLKGNYTAARDAFNKAIAADSRLDAAYVGLAETYTHEGDDASSIKVLEAARSKLPGHYPLEYYFGSLASRMGLQKQALAALETAAQLEPNSADPQFELGKLYASQQDWPRARESFERVIQLNPQFVPAHFQLSHVYAHLGLSSKAAAEAEQTHLLVDAQRDTALKKQRDEAAGFQAQLPKAAPPQP